MCNWNWKRFFLTNNVRTWSLNILIYKSLGLPKIDKQEQFSEFFRKHFSRIYAEMLPQMLSVNFYYDKLWDILLWRLQIQKAITF